MIKFNNDQELQSIYHNYKDLIEVKIYYLGQKIYGINEYTNLPINKAAEYYITHMNLIKNRLIKLADDEITYINNVMLKHLLTIKDFKYHYNNIISYIPFNDELEDEEIDDDDIENMYHDNDTDDIEEYSSNIATSIACMINDYLNIETYITNDIDLIYHYESEDCNKSYIGVFESLREEAMKTLAFHIRSRYWIAPGDEHLSNRELLEEGYMISIDDFYDVYEGNSYHIAFKIYNNNYKLCLLVNIFNSLLNRYSYHGMKLPIKYDYNKEGDNYLHLNISSDLFLQMIKHKELLIVIMVMLYFIKKEKGETLCQ